ncbi:MAG: ribosome small subunit-dependent GTPase A [Opitutae bacterium]|nr:ribosome small subunit-dependent GTPase A [Opitutae bacterium]
MNLREWGWDENWAAAFAPHAAAGLEPARVVRQDRGACEIQLETGGRTAEPTGRFRHAVEAGEADMPGVGDWVAVDPRPTCARAGIEAVLSRRTCLSRQEVGRATRAQVLAANVDLVFMVSALDAGRGFNLPRIERALALVRASGAEAVAVLNKADLCDDIGARVREAQSAVMDVPIVALSAIEGWGVDELRPWLAGNRTGVLLGPSGVGKSALVNALLGAGIQETQPVREEDARGRHTTTRRELFRIPSGGLLIDTAGLREFQPWGAGEELDSVFPEVAALAEQCRFRDCRHEAEPGCAVQRALGEGSLEARRFEHYLSLKREQAYQEQKRDLGAQLAEKTRWKKIAQWQKEIFRHRDR